MSYKLFAIIRKNICAFLHFLLKIIIKKLVMSKKRCIFVYSFIIKKSAAGLFPCIKKGAKHENF